MHNREKSLYSVADQKSPFISETVRDRPMVAIEHLFEVIDGISNGIIFDDLEWPITAFQGHCILLVEYIKNVASLGQSC